jgi:SprT protein
MIEPIEEHRQSQVLDQNEYYVGLAEQLFQRAFDRVPVLFDLSGRTAGMFKVLGKKRWIRYNPWIFAKYYDENLASTVPHEVAHYIVHELYGLRSVKPHGKEWLVVMNRFDADPGVTFKLDLSGVPQRRQRTHSYRCGCRTHQVSSTRHNRVLRGQGDYLCRYCHVQLEYTGS